MRFSNAVTAKSEFFNGAILGEEIAITFCRFTLGFGPRNAPQGTGS